MSRIAPIGLLLAGMTLGTTQVPARAGGEHGGDVLKVVVHVNFAESGQPIATGEPEATNRCDCRPPGA